MTVHLPPHRVQRLDALLTSTLDSPYTTRRRWQWLLGVLHSMVPAIHMLSSYSASFTII
jgi:hypothetical protein